MFCKRINKNTVMLDNNITYETSDIKDGDNSDEFEYIQVPEGLNPNYVKAALIDDVIVLIEDSIAKKAYLVDQAYNQLQTDVYAQMLVVFGTNKSDSAAASERTWEKMLAKPLLYVGPLYADEAAVLAEASAKVPMCEAYSVYRLERIAKFRADRATILAAE
jgi:hypothetical protein